MKGEAKVIDQLNTLLANELAAMDQYFLHSRMYKNWGYGKLFERINHEMEEETQHAEALIERILFLEGEPDMQTRAALKIGQSVEEMLANDLTLEREVRRDLQDAIATCETVSDFQTREMLEKLLVDTEEDHIYWLETQLRLIKSIGQQNYLQSMM